MGKSRQFPAAFKADAVDLVRTSDKSIAEIARDLGIGKQTLHNWVAQANKEPASPASDLSLTERDELRRLRREVATLRMERDILKKAAAFFANEAR
jgi:transposase